MVDTGDSYEGWYGVHPLPPPKQNYAVNSSIDAFNSFSPESIVTFSVYLENKTLPISNIMRFWRKVDDCPERPALAGLLWSSHRDSPGRPCLAGRRVGHILQLPTRAGLWS